MSPRGKLAAILGVEVLAMLALIAFLAGVLLRTPAPAPLPGLVTAARTPSPVPGRAHPIISARIPTEPVIATWTPPAAPANTQPLPDGTVTAAVTASSAVSLPVSGEVNESGGGLRLRQSPGTAGAIVGSLSPFDVLQIVGRTADNVWLQVITPKGKHGWVKSVWVKVTGDIKITPVTGKAVDAPDTALTYLSGITAHAREIFLTGQGLGNRDYAFSKVGDSNTDNPAFLTPFDQGTYDLGPYANLAPNINFFRGSFARVSDAAVGGFSTAKLLDPSLARAGCASGETPLACEYRLNKPGVALILLGTGDQHSWQGFEARYRTIIEFSIQQGVVPVLITKADDLESKEDSAPPGFTNDTIRRLAQEYDVPLLDLRRAVEPLPSLGCGPDGFHYNSPPDGQTANFDAAHLVFGYNMRNLTALEALDALRRFVLY